MNCWNTRTLFETCVSTSSLQPPPDSANCNARSPPCAHQTFDRGRRQHTTSHHTAPCRPAQSFRNCTTNQTMATIWPRHGKSLVNRRSSMVGNSHKARTNLTQQRLTHCWRNEHMKKRCQTKQKDALRMCPTRTASPWK